MKIIFATMLTLFSTAAFAQAKGYAGAVGGFSVPDAEDSSGRPIFGAVAGARLDGELGLGAYFLTSSKKETINGSKTDFDYSMFGIEGSFHFEGIADGAFVALRMGLAKIKAGSANISPFSYGLGFGYDYFFNDNMSVGIDAGFMSVQKGSDTVNGVSVEQKAFNMLNFMAALKFWF